MLDSRGLTVMRTSQRLDVRMPPAEVAAELKLSPFEPTVYIVSVSYTHLVVRQFVFDFCIQLSGQDCQIICMDDKLGMREQCKDLRLIGTRVAFNRHNGFAAACTPVSYTHLDVYKRQPL